MNIAIAAAAVIALVLLGAALLVVWSRRVRWMRSLAIPLAILASAASAATVACTLGNAVPLIGGITAPAGGAPLLSAKLIPGDGLYLTLDLPVAPRLFWLPWDKKMAEDLQEMLSNPNNAAVVMVVPPFEWSWDTSDPTFQPLPQPKVLPDKPPEAKPAPHFSA
ncbi:MAG: hypothetical protein ACYCZ0_04885 [Minisyncoccota bacterium]